MKRGWIGLAVALLAVGCSKKDTIDPGTWNSYRNPVEKTEVLDPAIYEEDGKFYMFSNGSGDSVIPMMVSTDLTKWEMAINIFTDETMPAFIGGVVPQAPEVAKVGDLYLIYYSMYKSAEQSGIGVAVADLVTGPYFDKGKVIQGSDYGITGVMSPSFLMDGETPYLAFGNFGGLYVVELSADGQRLAGSPVKVASELFDAPCLRKVDDKYYLFASINSTSGGADSSCQQVVGRADNVYGPYFDKNSKPMTDDGYEVLIKNSTKFTGAGHGTVFDVAGKSTWILYNAYDLSDVSRGRNLMLDHIDWQNGWPVVRGSIVSFCADAPALN